MKGRIYKTGLVLTAILTCLLMISTATAVPVANSEPVMDFVEEQEELQTLIDNINELQKSNMTKQEKQRQIKKFLSSDKFSDINIDAIYLFIICLLIDAVLFCVLPILTLLTFIIGVPISTIYYYNYRRQFETPDNLKEHLELILECIDIGFWIIFSAPFYFIVIVLWVLGIIEYNPHGYHAEILEEN